MSDPNQRMRRAHPERDVLRGPMRTVSSACTVYDEIERGTWMGNGHLVEDSENCGLR